jgi:ABC-type phosphate transport system substrate-binding protein
MFAFSENTLTAAQKTANPGLRTIPMGALGVGVIYNLKAAGVTNLILDRETLVLIFNNTITNWSDTRLQALQDDGVVLPNATITKVVRSESSGTTGLFSGALAKFDSNFAAKWGSKFSTWPAKLINSTTYVPLEGSSKVANQVYNNLYSIGYNSKGSVDNQYATLKNKVNRALALTTTTVANAVQDNILQLEKEAGANHLEGDLIDGDGRYSYPICGYTYLIYDIYQDTNCTQSLAMYDLFDTFVYSMIDTTAQSIIESKSYISFNSDRTQELIDQIVCRNTSMSKQYWGKLFTGSSTRATPPAMVIFSVMIISFLISFLMN